MLPTINMLDKIHSIDDCKKAAAEKLPSSIYSFFNGGADAEVTLQENANAYKQIFLLPKVLKSISQVDLSTELMGKASKKPILIAPMAFQKLAHPQGEGAVARASKTHGTSMILSLISSSTPEEVAKTGVNFLQQLYIFKDRGITKNFVQQVEDLGCQGIVLTVDMPVYGKRLHEKRNPISIPDNINFDHLTKAGLQFPHHSSKAAYLTKIMDPGISWKDIAWLQSITDKPVLLKGILHPEDARIAGEHGIKTIIVSNHGGRQLDTSVPAIKVLPRILDHINGEVEVIVDGGIQHGTDILKAIALGAKAVLIGRPVLWGLSIGGEAGVDKVLSILEEELSNAMILSGCKKIDELNKDIIF